MFDFIIHVGCSCENLDIFHLWRYCCSYDRTGCFKECCSRIGCGNGGCFNPISLLDHLKDKDLSDGLSADINQEENEDKAEDKSLEIINAKVVGNVKNRIY